MLIFATVEKVFITLKNFFHYAHLQQDEIPLYVFDRKFYKRGKAAAMLNEYNVRANNGIVFFKKNKT